MIAFDGSNFYRSDGTCLDVGASQKADRWYFRLSNGKLLASGMTPEQFVREFWLSEMENV